ncbi:MAG: alpha/beta fold hydrolase [Rhodocyclaceae bacterium]
MKKTTIHGLCAALLCSALAACGSDDDGQVQAAAVSSASSTASSVAVSSSSSTSMSSSSQTSGPSDATYQTSGILPATSSTPNNLPVFYQKIKDRLTFPMAWKSGTTDMAAWRAAGRAKVKELLLQPEDNTAFNPVVIDEQDNGTYWARKVVFNLTADSRVLGLMLVPKGAGPFPAAVLLHDHGGKFDIGKEKLIKPWGDATRLTSAEAWSAKYFSNRFVGDELVKRGYVVLAVDALGWGDRGGYTAVGTQTQGEQQQALAANLLNLGDSLGGLMAREDVRAADFLASLSVVDTTRIAAVGFSMGAYRAWQLAALSDHIAAGVAVCWMATTDGLMVPGNNQLKGQSAFNMMHPGLLRYLDFPDVASLAAPKPMLFYNGGTDTLFPTASVDVAYNKMAQVWAAYGAADKLSTQTWSTLGHVFVQDEQDAAFTWLDAALKR